MSDEVVEIEVYMTQFIEIERYLAVRWNFILSYCALIELEMLI